MATLDNFHQIKENVSLYFDNALSKEDEKALLQKVENDPDCCHIFEKEKTARQFLKNKLKRSTVSKDLMNNIKSKLFNQ